MVDLPVKRRAFLAWISRDDELVPEMRELAFSAGYHVVDEVRQVKEVPDPKYYFGSGKVTELSRGDGVEFLLTPADLTPPQVYSISKVSGLVVLDRLRVILELFKERASTPESRLQVELADLHHQLPIIKEYIHQGTLKERPGFLGGGEYRVDYYYEMARKKMARIRKELALARKARGQKRALRKRRGARSVSMAGYTNAGKSSLFNALISDEVPSKSSEVSPKVFTTLGTSTRKMKGLKNCMVTDTVGFIRDLPPWLIEGFMSTLEEVFLADVVLLAVDCSEPDGTLVRKLSGSLDVLRIGNTQGKVVLVLNKSDLDPSRTLLQASKILEGEVDRTLSALVHSIVIVSAKDQANMDGLLDAIREALGPLTTFSATLPQTKEGFEAARFLKELSEDSEEAFVGGLISIAGTTEDRWTAPMKARVLGTGGGWTASLGPPPEEKGFIRLSHDIEGS